MFIITYLELEDILHYCTKTDVAFCQLGKICHTIYIYKVWVLSFSSDYRCNNYAIK